MKKHSHSDVLRAVVLVLNSGPAPKVALMRTSMRFLLHNATCPERLTVSQILMRKKDYGDEEKGAMEHQGS